MALAIASLVANRQIFGVAVAAIAQGLDMLQRGCVWRDMLAANPARHDAVQLPRNGFVHLDPEMPQTTHRHIFVQKQTASRTRLLVVRKRSPQEPGRKLWYVRRDATSDRFQMNAHAASGFSGFGGSGGCTQTLRRAMPGRNSLIALTVVALHVGLIWTLQSGLLMRTAALLVPVELLAQLVEPPAPKPEPEPLPLPAPAPPPTRPPLPAPAVPKKAVTPAPVQPQRQPKPLAVAEPATALSSPNAPTGSVIQVPPAPPASPVQEFSTPAAPPAPSTLQLPSSNADYLQNPKPAYPPLSKRLGEQGKVITRVLIGADGVPQKAEIRQSSGFERLDQAALATVLKWRYVPGRRGGVAEEMWVNVPINFVLE